MKPTYSVIVPVHNEEESLSELHRRLVHVLDSVGDGWELIIVDDGSDDRSLEAMLELRAADPRVKVVRLSRNFGKEIAITAGLDLAAGDAVIVMDSDLQHPPEVVPELIARWREGYEIVYGVMASRQGETWFKKRTSSLYYRLLGRLTDVEIPAAVGDFRLVDRKPLDAFLGLRERNRFVRGMFSWVGFRQIGVPYAAAPRYAGNTSFTLFRMIRLAKHGVLSFSTTPLRLVLTLGFVVSGLAIVETVFAIANRIGGYDVVPGWASTIIVASFLGGIQLIVLGVMGEYLGLIYEEVKRRPIYLVSELHGFEADH
jgi:dolichol-phosphate mannosyltransferase